MPFPHCLKRIFQLLLYNTRTGGTKQHREIEQRLIGPQVNEKIQDFIYYLERAAIRPIDLVNQDDGLHPPGQGFLQHKPGLRHRAFKGIHHQEGTVHHIHDPFHFSAEISVARCIHNIDFIA